MGIFYYVLSLPASSTYIAPEVSYRTYNLEPKQVEGIEEFMRLLAQKWSLSVLAHERHVVGKNGLAMFFLYEEGDNIPILFISTTGPRLLPNSILSWYVHEHEKIYEEDLEQLIGEVKQGLESKFGLEFCTIDLVTSRCAT